MKITSIKFKLITGGISLVLLPLIIIGTISTTRSSRALMAISKSQAEAIASDLARLVDTTLQEEIKIAEVIATDRRLRDVLSISGKNEAQDTNEQIESLFQELKQKYNKLGSEYEGILVSDAEGNLITGVYGDGKEYKGINIADR